MDYNTIVNSSAINKVRANHDLEHFKGQLPESMENLAEPSGESLLPITHAQKQQASSQLDKLKDDSLDMQSNTALDPESMKDLQLIDTNLMRLRSLINGAPVITEPGLPSQILSATKPLEIAQIQAALVNIVKLTKEALHHLNHGDSDDGQGDLSSVANLRLAASHPEQIIEQIIADKSNLSKDNGRKLALQYIQNQANNALGSGLQDGGADWSGSGTSGYGDMGFWIRAASGNTLMAIFFAYLTSINLTNDTLKGLGAQMVLHQSAMDRMNEAKSALDYLSSVLPYEIKDGTGKVIGKADTMYGLLKAAFGDKPDVALANKLAGLKNILTQLPEAAGSTWKDITWKGDATKPDDADGLKLNHLLNDFMSKINADLTSVQSPPAMQWPDSGGTTLMLTDEKFITDVSSKLTDGATAAGSVNTQLNQKLQALNSFYTTLTQGAMACINTNKEANSSIFR